MESKLIHQSDEKTYAVVFDSGDSFPDELLEFARQEKLTAAHFTAIGAFQKVTLGWFNLDKQDYEKHELDEQVEVLSLVGNIAEHEGAPKIHAHVVVGKRDTTAVGGHLLSAQVRPTLEVIVVESPRHLHRRYDEATGLPLIRPEQSDLPPRGGRSPHAGVH